MNRSLVKKGAPFASGMCMTSFQTVVEGLYMFHVHAFHFGFFSFPFFGSFQIISRRWLHGIILEWDLGVSSCRCLHTVPVDQKKEEDNQLQLKLSKRHLTFFLTHCIFDSWIGIFNSFFTNLGFSESHCFASQHIRLDLLFQQFIAFCNMASVEDPRSKWVAHWMKMVDSMLQPESELWDSNDDSTRTRLTTANVTAERLTKHPTESNP